MSANASALSFKATGSPTPRSIGDRAADIYNVRDFGAIGDASHDDTNNINAAVTAASNRGTIFFPKGTYKITSAILVPSSSSLIFTGQGDGSAISANFNGFAFDNLSSPYSPASGISAIEKLNIQNSYTGNNYVMTAAGTWSASGSPTNITVASVTAGVAIGGALCINDGNFSTNSIFVGMITNIVGTTVTVASAAVGSGATSNLTLHVVQAYLAGASWITGATTITMSSTPPAGISGQYYIYDYDYILGDPKGNGVLGVGIWTPGTTTLALTPGTSAIAPSVTAADRIWLAPVAGCIRYSSVVGATVRDCTISGFIGVTASEDKIVANDPTVGAAEGFEITVERCNFSNPSGCSSLFGQTGIYLINNSCAYYNSFNSMWCGVRISGAANKIMGGRAEVCYFAYLVSGDFTATNNTASNVTISDLSMESNLIGIYIGNASAINISAVGALNNVANAPSFIAGLYINSIGTAVIQNSTFVGNFQSGYGIYIADVGSNRGNTTFIGVAAVNLNTPAKSWRIPAQAWWGTATQCSTVDGSGNALGLSLEYAFSGLPTGSGSPAPIQGETYDLSDCSTSTFLATAAGGGTGAAAHRRVRYNAVSTVWQVVG